MTEQEYVPIDSEVAKKIAEDHSKSIVIIAAWDPVHGALHTVSYGVSPADKASAALGAELATKALGASAVIDTKCFRDYRLAQARKLLNALKSLVKLCDETFKMWDKDDEIHVGKMLRFMGDPKLHGYRKDIDDVHNAVAEGEKFIDAEPQPIMTGDQKP